MQSESTLWRLNFFVKEALEVQGKNSGSLVGNENQNNNKRKRELCDAIAKTKKTTKKPTWRPFGVNMLILDCLKWLMMPKE